MNYQRGVDVSRKGWGHKKIRKKQRMRPAGWHGNHPAQKPEKRWSRQTLESIILPDGSIATVRGENFGQGPKRPTAESAPSRRKSKADAAKWTPAKEK